MSGFTTTKINELIAELEKAFKEIGEKHGVTMHIGTVRYDSNQFTSQLKVTYMNEGEDPQEAEFKVGLKRDGWKFNLTEENFNDTFMYVGELYKVKSISPRSRKYPVIAQKVSDGRFFKLPGRSLSSIPR